MRLYPFVFLFVLGLASPGLSQNASAGAKVPEAARTLLLEAREMRIKHRYSEALDKLAQAEKLAPNLADIYALRGDIYLAPRRRDFALALPQFQKAAALQPQSPLPRFNLAEYYFVKHEFDTALDALTKLDVAFPKLPEMIRHLVRYKQMLCQLKLGHRDEAEQIVAKNFKEDDNTPAFYFANAGLAFAAGDAAKANDWVKRGVSIFKGAVCEPFYDSFKELRWVPDVDFGGKVELPPKR